MQRKGEPRGRSRAGSRQTRMWIKSSVLDMLSVRGRDFMVEIGCIHLEFSMWVETDNMYLRCHLRLWDQMGHSEVCLKPKAQGSPTFKNRAEETDSSEEPLTMGQHEAKCWGYKEEKILALSSLRAGKIFIFLGFPALNTKHRTSFKNNKKPTQSSMNQGFCLI